MYIAEAKTWESAKTHCERLNGILAEPRTTEEMWVARFYRSTFHVVGIWVGASDRLVKGLWQWESDNRAVASDLWTSRQPNNYLNQDCGDVREGGLSDVDCDEHQPFICEFTSEEHENICF